MEKNYLLITKGPGKFFNVTFVDAYILNYLFNYKVKNNNVGFPLEALTKVLNKLDELKIDYQVIFNDKEPMVKKFKKLNKYEEYVEKAKKNFAVASRLEELLEKVRECDIKKIEEITEALEKCLL